MRFLVDACVDVRVSEWLHGPVTVWGWVKKFC